jgi:hypothetical protein
MQDTRKLSFIHEIIALNAEYINPGYWGDNRITLSISNRLFSLTLNPQHKTIFISESTKANK